PGAEAASRSRRPKGCDFSSARGCSPTRSTPRSGARGRPAPASSRARGGPARRR
ncbi:MAG: hypothetical protein AVDCRST_MAG40-2094, partial [uncultured Gemmatimonadaceae bacterium]